MSSDSLVPICLLFFSDYCRITLDWTDPAMRAFILEVGGLLRVSICFCKIWVNFESSPCIRTELSSEKVVMLSLSPPSSLIGSRGLVFRLVVLVTGAAYRTSLRCSCCSIYTLDLRPAPASINLSVNGFYSTSTF